MKRSKRLQIATSTSRARRPFIKDRQRHREHHPLQGLWPGTQQTSKFRGGVTTWGRFLKKTHPSALGNSCLQIVCKNVYMVYTYYIPQCLYVHIVSLVGIVFRSRWSRPKRMHLGNSDPPIPQSWRNVLPLWRESPNMPLEHLSFHAHENLSSKSYPVISKSPSWF